MMISPNYFVYQHEGESFEQLIKTRNSLMRDIKRLEKVLLNPEKYTDEYQILPSPSTQYKMNLQYLAELCGYMEEVYSREFEEQVDYDGGYLEDCGGISDVDFTLKK